MSQGAILSLGGYEGCFAGEEEWERKGWDGIGLDWMLLVVYLDLCWHDLDMEFGGRFF